MEKSSQSPSPSQLKSAKRIKLFNDDPEAQRRNLELLKCAKTAGMSTKTYPSLINETFSERRNFVKNKAQSSAEVLEMCPYLAKQEHVNQGIFMKVDMLVKTCVLYFVIISYSS